MRRSLLVAALLSAAASVVGRAADPDAEKELAQLSRRIDDAYVRADTAFLADVLADDWTRLNHDGSVTDKAALMKALKEGSTRFTVMKTSEVEVRVYGDAGVVTGRDLFEYRYQGRQKVEHGRFSRIFVRKGGRWQHVYSQSTLVLAELPGVHQGGAGPPR